jgi:hypothetical protein
VPLKFLYYSNKELSLFVDNTEKFQTNLAKYQKGAYYAEIKLFSTVPASIKRGTERLSFLSASKLQKNLL